MNARKWVIFMITDDEHHGRRLQHCLKANSLNDTSPTHPCSFEATVQRTNLQPTCTRTQPVGNTEIFKWYYDKKIKSFFSLDFKAMLIN